ncbi:MAG: hypothetical protein JWN69_1286 [Alphaproteobacteria bacterium]|nr:hypothetical protein [Alphaproteobacteria bacterium]
MSRLSPLITRRVGARAPEAGFATAFEPEQDFPAYLEDVKLFAIGWLGGLIFFGTFFS